MTVLNMLSENILTRDLGSRGFFMVKHLEEDKILVQTCIGETLSRIEEFRLDLFIDIGGWPRKGFRVKDRIFYIDEFLPLN